MVKSGDKIIIFLTYHMYLIYLQLYNWEMIDETPISNVGSFKMI
jgi:hypothetical protein